jgi:methyl-accepting chemotaxis protein
MRSKVSSPNPSLFILKRKEENMFKKMKLQTKLLVIGGLLTIIPLLIVSVVVFMQNRNMLSTADTESIRLAYADLDHIAEAVFSLAQSHQEVIEQNVGNSLNVAREVVANSKGIWLADTNATWNAVNQYSQASSKVELPRMMLDIDWFGQVKDPNTRVPVVDKVHDLSGVTCTVFQRMNEAGDMLRIATSVLKKDGTRAIGTYIPRINPDGKPNPVVSAVLKGQTFNGRAFVVNAWYITAYEPIYDAEKNIIGMLYVGVPQESAAGLRKAIMNIKVGKTGYVYVLDSKGHYVISKDGARDGEDIRNAKDDNGNLFIQEICEKALALGPGEIAEQKYLWKNPGDPTARTKIARIKYFKPWDWVIGVGSYEEEFLDASNHIEQLSNRSNIILVCILGLSLIGALFTWWIISKGIAKPINRTIDSLTEGADQVASASTQVSSASQSLAEGASEQASSLEETSSSLEEMAAMTKQNADNATQADTLMKEANQVIGKADTSMTELTTSMEEISRASEETSKIIKTIDEIAFQTNLLALNAAVEAARAGEAGAGFAVVADEVRNLAMRAADAAKNTADLIEGTVKKVKDGGELVTRTNEAFAEVAKSASKVGELVGEIAAASNEQASGIEQVNKAVTEMDKVTQTNAANAEESAAASEEMNAQAAQMKGVVEELGAIVGRSADSRDHAIKRKQTTQGADATPGAHKALAAPAKNASEKRITVHQKKEAKPDEVIPMDEGDFKDF